LADKQKVVRLEPWEEAVGTLREVDYDRGLFRFHQFDVAVTPKVLPGFRELDSLIGERVAILRTDILERPWLIRALKNRQGDGDGDGTGFLEA